MTATLLAAAGGFYGNQKAITAEVLTAAKRVWGTRPPANFDAWFAKNVDRLVAIVELGQQSAIAGVSGYVDDALAEQGMAPRVLADVDTTGLVGVASDGRPLDSLMYGSVITAKGRQAKATAGGATGSQALRVAWESGLQALLLRVQTQVADASRVATGMEITSRRDTGYVRMLNPPSCARCTVLAGRFYRFSAGFLRHPGCDCRHVPSTEDAADDLRTDSMFQFLALPEEMQDRIYTKAGAQAIRDGADMAQVVNARRGANGLATAGRLERRDVYGQQLFTTTEGVTKRGVAGKVIRGRGRNPKTTPRLMPEDIYEITGGDRDDALRLLERNGYVLRRSGPTSGTGSRTSLVPQLGPSRRRSPDVVDIDAQQRTADVAAWLEAEERYRAAVRDWLAAEQSYRATRPARTLTEREGRELGASTWFDYADTLPDDQRRAVQFYTGNGYEDVNERLRDGTPIDGVDEKIALIDAAIAAAPTVPTPIVVGRSVAESVFGLPRRGEGPITAESNAQRLAAARALRGRPLRDDGYMSTSLQTDSQYYDRHEVSLQLEVPAGTKALYVSAHPNVGDSPDPRGLAAYGPDENELLLGRGIEYEVIDAGIDKDTGDITLRVRVTGQTPTPASERSR